MSFLALHLILWVVFFWRGTQWTLMSPCAGVFAQLWNSALVVWKMFALFFFFVFGPCRDCRELVTVALVGARATLPFSGGACKLFLWTLETVLVSGVRPEDHCFCMSSHTTDGSFL